MKLFWVWKIYILKLIKVKCSGNLQIKLDRFLSSLQNIFILGLLFKFYSRSQSVLRVRNLYLINFAEISEYVFYYIYLWRIQIFFLNDYIWDFFRILCRTMENYHVLEIIGEGSFGKVYKGRKKYSSQVQTTVYIYKMANNSLIDPLSLNHNFRMVYCKKWSEVVLS